MKSECSQPPTSPFIGLFISMCGCRKTAIIGGILNALGWILSAYASNVHYLFLTFGVTAGVGSGMVYLPAVVMVGQYFQKRRALAQGLSTTGTGFGAFLMTALLKYLCTEFGWRNAMFIQGAISLNLCVCGALMRPLSPKDTVSEKYVVRSNSGDNQARALSHSAETIKSNGVLSEEPEKKEEATNEEVLDSVQHIEMGGKSRSGRNMYGLRVLKTVSQLTATVRKGFAIWYSSYFGAASLFTNRVFVAFIIWALFAYSSFVIPFIHLPEIVKQYNLSSQNNIFPLTSIIAIVHIFGKVILGIISDLPCISTWNVFLMANFTLVTCILTLPLMQTYISLAVVCALIGFSSGYFSLMPVVTEDLVGTKHLANAYGIIICANGISALLGPPFAARNVYFGDCTAHNLFTAIHSRSVCWIYDITHKYDFSFYISGLLYMVGIIFLLIQPCIQKKQPREKSTEEAQV
ncbi:monocarboxylate transporter 14 isoform X4 [Mycteria americana]|uniref:monocarboxylate transporter 14 isoform X4 n=1 Tax=Mycteria americana TaxID=33587 RepID=UPI003F589F97